MKLRHVLNFVGVSLFIGGAINISPAAGAMAAGALFVTYSILFLYEETK